MCLPACEHTSALLTSFKEIYLPLDRLLKWSPLSASITSPPAHSPARYNLVFSRTILLKSFDKDYQWLPSDPVQWAQWTPFSPYLIRPLLQLFALNRGLLLSIPLTFIFLPPPVLALFFSGSSLGSCALLISKAGIKHWQPEGKISLLLITTTCEKVYWTSWQHVKLRKSHQKAEFLKKQKIWQLYITELRNRPNWNHQEAG